MKKSDTFLNLVAWVIAGAVFATGAVLFVPRDNGDRDRAAVVPQNVAVSLEQK